MIRDVRYYRYLSSNIGIGFKKVRLVGLYITDCLQEAIVYMERGIIGML